MEITDDLTGQLARLPDGQKVVIESVEGLPPSALVRRIDGPRAETHAICDISKLQPLDSENDKPYTPLACANTTRLHFLPAEGFLFWVSPSSFSLSTTARPLNSPLCSKCSTLFRPAVRVQAPSRSHCLYEGDTCVFRANDYNQQRSKRQWRATDKQ